jgi:hypothetical protein
LNFSEKIETILKLQNKDLFYTNEKINMGNINLAYLEKMKIKILDNNKNRLIKKEGDFILKGIFNLLKYFDEVELKDYVKYLFLNKNVYSDDDGNFQEYLFLEQQISLFELINNSNDIHNIVMF